MNRQKERRHHPREIFQIPEVGVVCPKYDKEGSGSIFEHKSDTLLVDVLNRSESGLLLESSLHLKVGSYFDIRIASPHEKARQTFKGKVIWINKTPNKQIHYLFGIKFQPAIPHIEAPTYEGEAHRLKILNIWVDPVNKEQAIRRVKNYLRTGNRSHLIIAVNPEKQFSLSKDTLLYETFKTADLLIPDGIGVALAARILHGVRLTRVPGVELMEDICELAAKEEHKVFIYGASEKVNRTATERLKKRYPGLEIAGRSNGYVGEEEMVDLIHSINKSQAEVLFIALGSPKQERWIANYKHYLRNVKVCQGIGGTLDIIAGNRKRAPEIWQKFSAEWLYRLISEPRRLKRQKVLPIFATMVFISKLKCLVHFMDRK